MACFFEAEWGMLSSVEIMRRSCLSVSMTLENAGVARDCSHYPGERCAYFLLTLKRFT
jgi:hypothetical protein